MCCAPGVLRPVVQCPSLHTSEISIKLLQGVPRPQASRQRFTQNSCRKPGTTSSPQQGLPGSAACTSPVLSCIAACDMRCLLRRPPSPRASPRSFASYSFVTPPEGLLPPTPHHASLPVAFYAAFRGAERASSQREPLWSSTCTGLKCLVASSTCDMFSSWGPDRCFRLRGARARRVRAVRAARFAKVSRVFARERHVHLWEAPGLQERPLRSSLASAPGPEPSPSHRGSSSCRSSRR